MVLFAHSHTYGTKLYTITEGQKIYPFYLWLDCIRTINNPLFFMVSGALLIKQKDDDIKRLMRRIGKYLIVLIVFSLIQYEYKVSRGTLEAYGFLNFLKNIYSVPIHFSYWFIYVYLGYLIMLPFTQKIACGITKMQFLYLIFITLLFTDILPTIQMLVGGGGINISLYINTYTYAVFPIIGYYLHNHMDEMIFASRWKLYLLIGIATAGSCVATGLAYLDMVQNGVYTENYISYFNTLTAMAVFCVCYKIGKLIEKRKVICKVISIISSCVFGIYLMENILEDLFSRKIYELVPTGYPKLTMCIIYMTLTVISGTIITWLIKKIPLVGRLM